MAWALSFESLDDEPKRLLFDDKESAISRAVVWFASGYDPETNETMRSDPPSGLADYVERLIGDLREGREFSCNLMYERISLIEEDHTAAPITA